MITDLLHIQPSELKFPVQSNKPSNCWLQLTNRTDHNVAFKVKTTHPRKYCVRPNSGIVYPGSTCVIRVGMQAQKELVQAAVTKDKFLIQSMILPDGLSAENITSDLFRKGKGNGLEEQKLRVVFVTVDPPSPIPEVSEEEWSPDAAEQQLPQHIDRITAMFDAALSGASEFQDQFSEDPYIGSENDDQIFSVPSSHEFQESESASKLQELASEDWNTVSKMIEEKSLALLENRELQHKVELRKTRMERRYLRESTIILAISACFLGIIVGYVVT